MSAYAIITNSMPRYIETSQAKKVHETAPAVVKSPGRPLLQKISDRIHFRRNRHILERSEWHARRENILLRQQNEAARSDAHHDELTGLLNLRGLKEYLEQVESPAALLYIDGTNQKAVNDRFDHDRGNQAIEGTVEAIKRALRPDDVLARIGGDEYLAVLSKARPSGDDPDKSAADILSGTLGRIRSDESPYFLSRHPHFAAVGYDIAIGGALWEEGMSIDQVRLAAEADMTANKAEQHAIHGQHRPPTS